MTHPFPAAPLRAALPVFLPVFLAWMAAAAGAHAAPVHAPDAADPQAAVPATPYQPAFDWRLETPPSTRPDQHWQASNAIVAGTHAMSMPGMADHARTKTPAPDAAAHQHAGMALPSPRQEEQR